ncbi:T. brucei spp.-specific protein [Trypanosoma brucei gambiense DAL972]|uniref:T. brucei spp.-specific protein n=1 Tax=Trypanosoma brucei gambiense (strain MHOM/CI/86/DAL972) TaxID=679716 RepID=D0A7K9_TRYB9|nr:T. brucei spp.-specific protein [Trypanosoma brucei gambiense DAL972]CBH17660.1 T. brucei spp.-specific protein [Trypanosoma brucei gambiense DAL972]|eukprot:XP_011779924.1 T. brucei spp.-specific protein [Trypanosoma brucei gambiense DAL972]
MWIGIADFFFSFTTPFLCYFRTQRHAPTRTHICIYIYIYKYIHKHIQAHARVIDPFIQCSIAGTVIPPVCYICSPLFRVSLVFLQFFLLFFSFFSPLSVSDKRTCTHANLHTHQIFPRAFSRFFLSFLLGR